MITASAHSKPASPPRVTVVTHSPSPYQVELFNAVARSKDIDLHVIYLYTHDPQRMWRITPPAHSITLLERTASAYDTLLKSIKNDDLVVLNYFKDSFVDALLQRWTSGDKPWCFWGERPRVHAMQRASRLNRIWRLRALHRCRASIWGIGQMAVDAYREEFGPHRRYVNLPYYSNIDRFRTPRRQNDGSRVILFSGSLIRRKGVDLIATAFARLAPEFPNLRLRLMGSGDLESSLRRAVGRCADRVEFVGFRDWQVLPEEYARADVLCVPSRYDGWGLVVPEGLAAGLPVISTTQTGAAVEFLKTGRNGWLIPAGDEVSLLTAMREAAMMDDTALSALSAAAIESVSHHSLEDGARRFVTAAMNAIENW